MRGFVSSWNRKPAVQSHLNRNRTHAYFSNLTVTAEEEDNAAGRLALLYNPRTTVGAGFALLIVHLIVLLSFRTSPPGPFLSDLIQLMLGCLLVLCCFRAARASEGLACHFWQLASLAFSIWLVAQGIGTYSDILPLSVLSQWSENLLFSFWFVPLAMALFLDPDRERKGFDWLLVLDFVQAVLFCTAPYLYFSYIPRSESPTERAHPVWSPYS